MITSFEVALQTIRKVKARVLLHAGELSDTLVLAYVVDMFVYLVGSERSEETGRAVWRIERLYLENETPMYIGEVDKN